MQTTKYQHTNRIVIRLRVSQSEATKLLKSKKILKKENITDIDSIFNLNKSPNNI